MDRRIQSKILGNWRTFAIAGEVREVCIAREDSGQWWALWIEADEIRVERITEERARALMRVELTSKFTF
jgi:hypothetical protein